MLRAVPASRRQARHVDLSQLGGGTLTGGSSGVIVRAISDAPLYSSELYVAISEHVRRIALKDVDGVGHTVADTLPWWLPAHDP